MKLFVAIFTSLSFAQGATEKQCIEKLIAKSGMTAEYLSLNLMRCNNVLLFENETKYLINRVDTPFKQYEHYTVWEMARGVETFNTCQNVAYVLHQFETECENNSKPPQVPKAHAEKYHIQGGAKCSLTRSRCESPIPPKSQ